MVNSESGLVLVTVVSEDERVSWLGYREEAIMQSNRAILLYKRLRWSLITFQARKLSLIKSTSYLNSLILHSFSILKAKLSLNSATIKYNHP